MTEGIINSDGSRNWQANILLDNVKRLEQENKELKKANELLRDGKFRELDRALEAEDKYKSALEEINLILDELKQQYDYMTDYSEIKEIQDKINEVLK